MLSRPCIHEYLIPTSGAGAQAHGSRPAYHVQGLRFGSSPVLHIASLSHDKLWEEISYYIIQEAYINMWPLP